MLVDVTSIQVLQSQKQISEDLTRYIRSILDSQSGIIYIFYRRGYRGGARGVVRPIDLKQWDARGAV